MKLTHLPSCLKICLFAFVLFFKIPVSADCSNEEAFSHVYQIKLWGVNSEGEGSSGGGSTVAMTEIYRGFLRNFLDSFHIRSVVDFGCGDWEFSQFIDWSGIDYLGIDVVKNILEKNQRRFTQDNIHFIHADGLAYDLPEADLLICKEVLQHLPNDDILQFLEQIHKFKYCLLINDVHPQTHTSDNPDIKRAELRFLDLTQPPFNLNALRVLYYFEGFNLKQVLLVCRD